MLILLAEDDPVTRSILAAILKARGHEVTEVEDGSQAWGVWQLSAPRVVVADWIMPEMDGLELCRKIRATPGRPYTYFILQTGREGRESYLEAMDAGIDDFITKPAGADELSARLRVAERILGLREELLALEGLLSVCSYCKRMRNAEGYWGSLERYIENHSTAEFSHGICPECYEKHLKPHLGA
jgi:sigma-B regulation protein RsbU (phosphoserine phosphatase)